MSNERASIFGSEDLDLSEFTAAPRPKADKEAIRAAAEQRGFNSREPEAAPPKPAPAPAAKRKAALTSKAPATTTPPPAEPLPEDWRPRRRPLRTGRNQQFNMKASAESIQRFYRITEEQGWVLGETLEHALDALQREIDAKK
jgi:hypothetical protein